MITPIEIQSKTFKSGGLGYDKKDVDGFLREVLRSYETVYRENMELTDKVTMLTEGIQYYKTIEKTLQKALVLAEKTAEDTKIAAMEKAKNIEREARTRSQLIVADAKNELERIHNQTIQLIQQYEKYKVQFKNLAAAQMELIESEPFNISVARLDSFIDTSYETESTHPSEQPESAPKASMNRGYVDLDHQEEAAVAKEEQQEELPVEFDTSFMDSYDKPSNDSNNNQDNKSYENPSYLEDDDNDDEMEEDDDDFDVKPSKKEKKKKEKKHDFSFFRLDDDDEN